MARKDRVQQLDLPTREGFDAIFNAAILEDIPEAVSTWGSSRILLVASKGLNAQTDRVSTLQTALGDRLVHTKLGVGSHSPYADVRDIAVHIQQTSADCVISLGSSSYSDATKIACMLAANLPQGGFTEDDMERMIDQERGLADALAGGEPLRPRTCRLILVPTSLSASEWNGISSATNRDGKKQHFGGWDTNLADLILLDPRVAATSPEVLWLSSGVRCVDHCVELMCNPASGEEKNQGLHAYARRGLRCIIEGLTEYKRAKTGGVKTTPEDEDKLYQGISECQYGSREAIAGLLIYKVSMGPSHAIGHQLGSVAHVMHGVTSCVMLAPVLRWQLANLPDPHYGEMQAVILDIFNETLGWQEKSAGDAVEKFVKSIGLPTTLNEVGVTTDEQIRKIAERTLTDIWGKGKRQMELDDLLDVLNSARG